MALDTRIHALWAALTLAACAGDPPADEGHTTTSPGESDTGDPPGDTTGDPTSDTTGAQEPTLVVVVVAKPPYPEPNTPAVGAAVALDTAEGRLEATTDAEGRAYFEGFQWSGESVDVTVGALDYVMVSRLDLGEADTNEAGELELEIYAIGVSDSVVEISGPVLNKQADWHDVIASIGGPDVFWAPTSMWSASIAPDQPFSLVALELDYLNGGPNTVDNPIFGWFTLEHPGVSEDTQLAIDFAMPTLPDYAVGSYGVPERPDSPLRVNNFGFVWVVSETSGQLIGRATASSLSDDGNTIDYELEYVTTATAADPHTCFRVVSPVGPNYSTACIPGLPGDGAQDVEILDATEVPFVSDRSLYDPVEFELYDEQVVPELHIAYDTTLLWVVTGPEDATSLTVPQPPTGFEAGDTTLDVSLLLGRPAPSGEAYEAYVIMQPFSVDT
jgi:hypothetical protein